MACIVHSALDCLPVQKKRVYDASNYRGVHMTAQFAKILERFVGLAFLPTLACEISVGPNQFAYLKQRGARDALAYLVLSWLAAFREKASIALYMSDVSGAFDRVSSGRLLAKLRAQGMPQDLLSIIASWLRKREAQVVVGGVQSTTITLENQVFQGTVWGPSLWNTFYADSSDAIRKCSFEEIVFADDLNAWRKYEAGIKHDDMKQAMWKCQDELHKWGNANQVKFDAGKEHQLILNRHSPHGDGFALLGVDFDTKVLMSSAVHDLARKCQWKIKTILQTGRFKTGADLVNLYKAQVLSFIEYRTAAIYRACNSSHEELQHVQDKILVAAGLSAVEALCNFRLAPLSVRRDIALLGLIHRTVLGHGPKQFQEFFVRDEHVTREGSGKHGYQLRPLALHESDFRLPGSRPAAYIEHSAFGLIIIYNKLPRRIVEASTTVSAFQSALQDLVFQRALTGCDDWELTLSPRMPSRRHPLNSIY